MGICLYDSVITCTFSFLSTFHIIVHLRSALCELNKWLQTIMRTKFLLTKICTDIFNAGLLRISTLNPMLNTVFDACQYLVVSDVE